MASGSSSSFDAAKTALAGQPLPDDSLFYIHRSSSVSGCDTLEAECRAAITKPGCLIRIKGPIRTGKTSLVLRLIADARALAYSPVYCDLKSLEIADDLDSFLQSFCAQIAHRLGLPDRLEEFWDDLFGSAISCKSYFEEYLLPATTAPLLLVLDDIDVLFPYPALADEFFGLLRAWHEDAKTRDIWKQLRLVVTHSAEVYIPLNLNKSPFNVGLPVELSAFSPAQVSQLASTYGLTLEPPEAEQLIELLAGWPYLSQIALHHLATTDTSPGALVQAATAHPGPFSEALCPQTAALADPAVAAALAKIKTDPTVKLDTPMALKLQSLGLVVLQGQSARPSCVLYSTHLG